MLVCIFGLALLRLDEAIESTEVLVGLLKQVFKKSRLVMIRTHSGQLCIV
jgi:hypothetical protein